MSYMSTLVRLYISTQYNIASNTRIKAIMREIKTKFPNHLLSIVFISNNNNNNATGIGQCMLEYQRDKHGKRH